MRKIISSILCLYACTSIASDTITSKYEIIVSIMKSHPDSAIALSHELMTESKGKGNEFGVVRSNYVLGYIYDKIQIDYSNAIIFYLEAIRYAKESNYPDVTNDLVSLHKNCGVIFRKFNSFDLAISYYESSLSLAKELNDKDQIISISYNMAGLFSDMNRELDAIELLEQVSSQVDPRHSKYFNLNNRLSLLYLDTHQVLKAKELTERILSNGSPSNRELIDSHQILGRVALNQNNSAEAQKNFEKSFQIAYQEKEGYTRDKALFETYCDLANLNIQSKSEEMAIEFFLKAEGLIESIPQKPEYFKIYKSLADLYFDGGQYNKSKKYNDLYSESLNQYLKVQEDIQEIDRKYNMDLITKRYFDEVAKQERIASILFYSKLISGSLLALLLFTIGLNWYQKVKMRKGIVRELMALKVID